MIIDLNKNSLGSIKNLYLLHHVLPGLLFGEGFKRFVKRTGIGISETDDGPEIEVKLARLRELGARFRNADKSIWVNRISSACIQCDRAIGALTVDITHSCNRRCYHCFGDTSRVPQGQIYDYLSIIDEFAEQEEILSMGLSGGEPLLFKAHAVNCLGYVRERFPGAYKRLYTNGDFIDEEILKELQSVALDEIRFSIKVSDFEDWSRLRSKMALAKQYVPRVMVEMPVMPGTLEQMKEILLELDRLDIFGINLCEFCYCLHHASEFNERGYRVKFPPFRILYLGQHQYPGLPVAGSNLDCFDLLAFAVEQKLKLGVHYCSVENRLTSAIYDLNKDQAGDGIGIFSARDFFIKTGIVCGEEDVLKVSNVFSESGMKRFRVLDDTVKYLEFPLDCMDRLQGLELQVGVVSSVMEPLPPQPGAPTSVHSGGAAGGDARRKRVVKIDLTTPEMFDFHADLQAVAEV